MRSIRQLKISPCYHAVMAYCKTNKPESCYKTHSEKREMLLTPKMKYDYLKKRFSINPMIGKQEFKVRCEFCEKDIVVEANISRSGNPSGLMLLKGIFHHKDGNAENNSYDNIQVLCGNCRKHFQYWGMVQRYLKKISRTQEDLPDCSGIPSLYYPT